MAFEGTLKDFPLADIVQLIALQRKSGVLTLEGAEDAATIFFQDGAVVWARSRRHPLEERIRRILPLRGLVTADQLARAEGARADTGESLDRVLIKHRLLSEEQWRHAVDLEVRNIIHRVFRWRDGTYRFEARTALELPEGRIPALSSQALLLESFRQLDEWPPIARRIPSFDGVVFVRRPNDEIDLSALSPEEGRVLQLVDGRMRAADVVDASGLGEFEACKALAALVESGIIGLIPAAGVTPSPKAAAAAGVDRAWAIPTGWALWGGLAAWLALNLLLFRPWATASPSPRDLLKQVRVRAGMAALALRLDQYYAEAGNFPSDLRALVGREMVDAAALKDPWGRPYRYEVQGLRYVLRSTGVPDTPGRGISQPAGD